MKNQSELRLLSNVQVPIEKHQIVGFKNQDCKIYLTDQIGQIRMISLDREDDTFDQIKTVYAGNSSLSKD